MKTKKTKEAVSLIVLVLTIVIMIILAGVIIINLNNSGIIDRAKNAVSETNLKNMQELANVAWGEAYLAIKGEKTPELIKSTMLEKLKGKGVSEEELAKYTFDVTTGGVEVSVNTGSNTPDNPEQPEVDSLNPIGIVPEGAIYYRYTNGLKNYSEKNPNCNGEGEFWINETGGTEYKAGESFPGEPMIGDTYIYKNYRYVYNLEGVADVDSEFWSKYNNGVDMSTRNAWGVVYIGDEERPADILESINGRSVDSMWTAFYDNTNIKQAPTIPSTIKSMSYAFQGCSNLSGSITIHATPEDYEMCFNGTLISEILGDCGNKENLLGTSSYWE